MATTGSKPWWVSSVELLIKNHGLQESDPNRVLRWLKKRPQWEPLL